MEDIAYEPATAADLPAVRDLLERCGLPTDDLGPDHRERFFVCRARGELVGAVGLELLGHVGL